MNSFSQFLDYVMLLWLVLSIDNHTWYYHRPSMFDLFYCSWIYITVIYISLIYIPYFMFQWFVVIPVFILPMVNIKFLPSIFLSYDNHMWWLHLICFINPGPYLFFYCYYLFSGKKSEHRWVSSNKNDKTWTRYV